MEQSLSVLIALILVSFCNVQGWEAPDFCHQKECPEYNVVNTNSDFEERQYVSTDWITTKVENTGDSDLLAAHSRLKDYCLSKGYDSPYEAWPALITVTKGEDGDKLSMSWFVPPGTTMPENTDTVTLVNRPAATVYVRVFTDRPSVKSGEDNTQELREALVKAGKSFDPHSYTGAGYDTYFSLTHHSEIWIYAA
ncbi:heme-binding protein 2-like [Lates japonicus]